MTFIRGVLLAGVVLAWAVTASAAPFATLRWTNPCFNSAVDDSGNPYCTTGPDSCKDLHHVEVWGQPSWGGGWKKLGDAPTLFRACLEDTFRVDRQYSWAGWHFYVIPVDIAGHRAPCASNVIYSPGSAVTSVEPSPLIVADELWFDVRGRKLDKPPRNGIAFHAWRVRGRLQKPGQSVLFLNGEPRSKIKPPRWEQ